MGKILVISKPVKENLIMSSGERYIVTSRKNIQLDTQKNFFKRYEQKLKKFQNFSIVLKKIKHRWCGS